MRSYLIITFLLILLGACKTNKQTNSIEKDELSFVDSMAIVHDNYIQSIANVLEDSTEEFYSLNLKAKFKTDISYFTEKSSSTDENHQNVALLFSSFFDEASRTEKIVTIELEALQLYENGEMKNAVSKAEEGIEIYPFSMLCNYVLWGAYGKLNDVASSDYYFDRMNVFITGMIESSVWIGSENVPFHYYSPSRNSLIVIQNTYCMGKETYAGEYKDSFGRTIIEYQNMTGNQLFVLPKE